MEEKTPRKQLQQLYQLLIQPIAELLPSDPQSRVIFIPQDELFLVPFAALQDAKDKYLIEKHTILTAPSIQVNGLLTASEILNLKLNSDLVVLSACDTGRGRITGDGVVGLSRSLISAGVKSVIVSLWAVPDAPTASLMTEFYHQMQQQSDKAQALRSAMLVTIKQHPQPKDWAAFTLIGEAD